jgi:chromate transport protein ChrA
MIAFWDLNDWDFEILSIEIVNCVCYPFIFSHIFYIFLYFFIFFMARRLGKKKSLKKRHRHLAVKF